MPRDEPVTERIQKSIPVTSRGMEINGENIEFTKTIWASVLVCLRVEATPSLLYLDDVHVLWIVAIRLEREHRLLLQHSLQLDLDACFSQVLVVRTKKKIIGLIFHKLYGCPSLKVSENASFKDRFSDDAADSPLCEIRRARNCSEDDLCVHAPLIFKRMAWHLCLEVVEQNSPFTIGALVNLLPEPVERISHLRGRPGCSRS